MSYNQFPKMFSYLSGYEWAGTHPFGVWAWAWSLGVLISPYGWGLFYLWIWFLIYEAIYYLVTWGHEKHWSLLSRLGVFLASMLGWLCGRTAYNYPVLQCGTEC